MLGAFLVPGFRAAFVKVSGAFAKHNALALPAPIKEAMTARTRPDFMIRGQMIANATASKRGRACNSLLSRKISLLSEITFPVPDFGEIAV